MKDFRKIQQQYLKLQIIDKLHPKRILAEKYISDRYNSAFNAQLNSFMPSYYGSDARRAGKITMWLSCCPR